MKIKALVASFLCLGFISGCAEEKPSVATTVYPVQYLVEKIGGNNVTVTNISEDGMIQRAQIKKDYKDILGKADALFYIGGLEPYMDLYIDSIRSSKVDIVNLETKSAIYKFERYTTTYIEDKTTGVESPYYIGDEFKSLDTYDSDPMLWMDPVAMTSMGSDIRDYLSAKYPEYAQIFEENYKALEVELARLDADYQSIKDDKKNISFVAMTPSFGNWQKSYGVKVYPVSLSKYGALPTNDQLVSIKKRIQKDHVKYMAVEQNLPKDMEELQQKLIDELGLIPINMSNLSSLSEADRKATKDYNTIMYENLKMLENMVP